MKKLSALLASFCLCLNTGCTTFRISDIKPRITLPASGDCYGIKILSREEEILPKDQCDALKRRAIFLDSENWKMLRKDIQRNCQMARCKQLVGQFDQLFLAIDSAIQMIP